MLKELSVKRMSAFKFEIEMSVGISNSEMRSIETPIAEREDNPMESNEDRARGGIQNRISVIRKAPPMRLQNREVERRVKSGRENDKIMCKCKMRTENSCVIPPGAILIKDAIWYRIIEILLWKVLGEKHLTYWGYPKTPTYRLLWKIVHYYSYLQPGTLSALSLVQDHDCQGDIKCFMEHVRHFLNLCAPTRKKKEKFGWIGLSCEEILKKIYCEDLLPLLRTSDLTNYPNILESHKDILRLQRWQEQGFSAISWIGHQHFSRLRSRFPWCLQCCKKLRKSIISY